MAETAVRDTTASNKEDGHAAELRPGVALYHAHSSAMECSRFLVGLSADGVRFPRASRPAHIFFVLVRGRDRSPEAVCDALAAQPQRRSEVQMG
jgi:hypothetical protein